MSKKQHLVFLGLEPVRFQSIGKPLHENAIDAIFTHPAEMTINGLSAPRCYIPRRHDRLNA